MTTAHGRFASAGAGEWTARARTGGFAATAGTAYILLAWVLVLCVAYQVFLAGLAVFDNPLNWGRHVAFVHVFELIPVLMLILAAVARLPKGRWYYMGPVLLYFLIGLQYAFVALRGTAVAALHTVNALLIFWGSAALALRARRLGRLDAEG